MKAIQNIVWAGATALGLLASGCAVQDEGGDAYGVDSAFIGYQGSFAETEIYGTNRVLKAVMSGEIGDVGGIYHVVDEVSAYDSGDSLILYMTVDLGSDGAAMVIFDIWQPLESFASGVQTTQQAIQIAEATSITGCSGPEPGQWSFDRSADDIDVTITYDEQNPELATIVYEASIREYGYYDDPSCWESDYCEPMPAQDQAPRVVRGAVLIDLSQAPGGGEPMPSSVGPVEAEPTDWDSVPDAG